LADKSRYHTVYAKEEGSAAAPTAGLHFTPETLKKIESKGAKIARITLHIGLGTFRPVKTQNVLKHKMHFESYVVPETSATLINETKSSGGRIICVGTTSVRAIESAAGENSIVRPQSGETGIFIYPGYEFKATDALITNFHLPESTLIMLVCAFAGRENVLSAYREAVKLKYRFFSFGDAVLII
jgi:S-adenosylmethionine:tRNA ribosyltransferase-isomerase